MFNYNNYMQNQVPKYNMYQPYFSQNAQMQQPIPNFQQPQVQQQIGLQGKLVDSIDMVKSAEFSYDGSISYFPLTDGSAIVTKQLQADGTSKTTIYKPVENTEEKKATYITDEQLKEELKNVNGKEIKNINEEIKSIKREIRHILDDLKDKMED